jgi:hypothetical protein
MAVSDLLITVFGMPVAAREQILGTDIIDYGGVRGDIFCKMLEYTQDVSISCSILTLVAIATDRFCATLYPFKRFITVTRAKYIMVMIWVVSLIISIPLLVVMRVGIFDNEYACYEDWRVFREFGATEFENGYTIALFVVLYGAPLPIISILYGAIIIRVWKRKIPGQPSVRGRQLQQRTKKNVLKMFMTVVLCFMICWLPYHVIFFIYGDLCDPLKNVWFFGRFMGHANSSITPWIYVVFSRDYRKGIKSILLKCLSVKPPLSLSFQRSSVSIGQLAREPPKTNTITLKAYTNNVQ